MTHVWLYCARLHCRRWLRHVEHSSTRGLFVAGNPTWFGLDFAHPIALLTFKQPKKPRFRLRRLFALSRLSSVGLNATVLKLSPLVCSVFISSHWFYEQWILSRRRNSFYLQPFTIISLSRWFIIAACACESVFTIIIKINFVVISSPLVPLLCVHVLCDLWVISRI